MMMCFAFLFLFLVPWSSGLLWQIFPQRTNTQLHFDLSDGSQKYPRRVAGGRKEKIHFAKEALLIFDRNSDRITTQQQVDDFYSQTWKRKDLKTTWNASLATLSNVEGIDAVICILENAPWYQKHKKIKFLGGSKTRFVRSALESNLEYLDQVNGPHLRRAAVSTLYSLNVVSSVADAAIILSVAVKLLKLAHKHNVCFNGKDIAMMLYGLQYLSSDVPKILEVLSALTSDIIVLPGNTTARHLSMALYGVQGMNSKHVAVRKLLDALVVKLSGCPESFSPHEITMASYGLKNMNYSQSEVRQLLDVLADKITQCHGPFGAHDVSVLLHGVQDMSSEYPEVRKLLGILADKVTNCQERFSRQQIKYALSALKGKSNKYPEVRTMLKVLVKKAKEYLQSIRAK